MEEFVAEGDVGRGEVRGEGGVEAEGGEDEEGEEGVEDKSLLVKSFTREKGGYEGGGGEGKASTVARMGRERRWNERV